MRVGGNCIKYLKRGWNKKEGRETKILKRGCKQGQQVGALKEGGLEPPYKLWSSTKQVSLSGYSTTLE